MSKHTPGPWKIKWAANVMGNRRDTGGEGMVAQCDCHQSNEVYCGAENQSNARLIAAAPDLLEASKAMVASCGCEDGRVWRFADEIDDETGCYESCPRCSPARAAIAKAEGQEVPHA